VADIIVFAGFLSKRKRRENARLVEGFPSGPQQELRFDATRHGLL